MLIDGFVADRSFEAVAKGVLTQNAHHEGCFVGRKSVGGPFDEFGEIVNESRFELVLAWPGLLGAATRDGQQPGQTEAKNWCRPQAHSTVEPAWTGIAPAPWRAQIHFRLVSSE